MKRLYEKFMSNVASTPIAMIAGLSILRSDWWMFALAVAAFACLRARTNAVFQTCMDNVDAAFDEVIKR